jgi:hypothetical protein
MPTINPSQPIVLEGKPGNGLTIETQRTNWDDAIPVESVEAAEQLIINLIPSQSVDFLREKPESPTFIYDGLMVSQIPLVINRQVNLISARTRRGSGNVVLLGSKVLESLANFQGLYVDPEQDIGDWKFVGAMNGSTMLYSGPRIAEDEFLVVYNGLSDAIDAPAGLLVKDNEMRLYILPENKDVLGRADDYISRIKVVIN